MTGRTILAERPRPEHPQVSVPIAHGYDRRFELSGPIQDNLEPRLFSFI